MNSAEPVGERRRQARAGRGAGAPGGAARRPPLGARPREPEAPEAPGGGLGSSGATGRKNPAPRAGHRRAADCSARSPARAPGRSEFAALESESAARPHYTKTR